ncbi:phage tail protein [Acanthopleuribacter pedis]|uniref:Phage tail protein n=1 Tax=Acanthopleuribacter pedis TaxID=442870 RepID=A0A8J7U5W1_9BACT|nr:tail fiber protein [Acanthopleuribacter pedis]MBO1322968.1 phage tail protein [Acanthopleuribacter pedis]
MTEPYLGEIRIFSFNFVPRGWAACNGAILPISQNQSLYSLIGTFYGGDGRTSFALPDLRGRVPVHRGVMFSLGTRTGGETASLTVAEMAAHTHAFNTFKGDADVVANLGGYALADVVPLVGEAPKPYGDAIDAVIMSTATCANAGGGAPHENMQPTTFTNYCIATSGLFPSRN